MHADPVIIADRIAHIAGSQVTQLRTLGGGFWRAELADGTPVFAKTCPATTEAAGLRWLAQGGAATPDVIGHDDQLLVLRWVEEAAGDPRSLGRMLARLHASGAPAFGSPPPSAGAGWIGSAPMSYADMAEWPQFFVEHRVLPYLAAARTAGSVTAAQAAAVQAVCDRIDTLAGPPVTPARLHGDLWGGNVLWSVGGGVLIDPAAHGGHPESDIAMLLLFPPSGAAQIIAGYESVAPLPAGWRQRVDLHQLYPLLVHAVLFGGGYAAAVGRATGRLLGA